MSQLTDTPWIVFLVAMVAMIAAAVAGLAMGRTHHGDSKGLRDVFGVVQAATLTLLALIIGFSFSMALSRYDQRKNYEEAEANAIGTELARVDLLDVDDRPALKTLLDQYLQQRIAFYSTRDAEGLARIRADQGKLEAAMWSSVVASANKQPNPLSALAVAGMNDVLNSEGYTQAALWNRIPVAAWLLMLLIGMFCNVLLGYGAKNIREMPSLLLILPFFVALSFMFIADIDSPRGGLIRVAPQNLSALATPTAVAP